MNFFVCENITRYYREKPTIKDISLELEQGETVGLLGASGVGKTTLMNILAGVDAPDSGRVLLEGEEITGVPGKVSYMLQKALLLPFKTTMENVSLPLIIKGASKKEAKETAGKYLFQFGIEGYEDSYPYQLSGGMQQRAALLRTFLTGNKVMLLDEPFSALDSNTKEYMRNWYREIGSQLGLTTLFITHDIEEAITLSQRIYILADKNGNGGEIIEEIKNIPDISKEFLFSGEYQELRMRVTGAMGEG